jgi:hypothetical protein
MRRVLAVVVVVASSIVVSPGAGRADINNCLHILGGNSGLRARNDAIDTVCQSDGNVITCKAIGTLRNLIERMEARSAVACDHTMHEIWAVSVLYRDGAQVSRAQTNVLTNQAVAQARAAWDCSTLEPDQDCDGHAWSADLDSGFSYPQDAAVVALQANCQDDTFEHQVHCHFHQTSDGTPEG